MTSIIVLENKAIKSDIEQTMSAVKQQQNSRAILLTEDSALNLKEQEGIRISVRSADLLSTDIQSVLETVTDNVVIFIDARMKPSAEQLEQFVTKSNAMSAAIGCCSFESDSTTIELPQIGADSLVQCLSRESNWPFTMIAINKALLLGEDLEAQSASEYFGKAMIKAISEGEAIDSSSINFEIDQSDMERMESLTSLSHIELAECLRHAINSFNIEDLFPQQAWKLHGNESAATSYHTLCALFIKLEDAESALECLSLSDQLEDSPRSLALKGLIALHKGETLEAVANMVSSLQEYEKRKAGDNDSKHHLRFTPNNLEVINESLQSGLEALNKRDNSAALDYFADAIFNFDSFYQDYGLDQYRSRMN
ncbi:hypothetical protein OAO01_04430 [Oligoflexia bacterium]|nr:hypothetical protein [Oligoflexia bacterium]